jgi:streptogramin lyase
VRRAQVFSNSGDFRQPTAIAVDSDGTVWVGDQKAQAIFKVLAKNKLTTYRLAIAPDSKP